MKTSSVRSLVFCFIAVVSFPIFATQASTCVPLIERIAQAQATNFKFKHRSTEVVLGTAIGALLLSQGLLLHSFKFWTPEFWPTKFRITIFGDPSLTLFTHRATMGDSKLARLFQGKLFGPNYKALKVIAFNIIFGTLFIHGTWAVTKLFTPLEMSWAKSGLALLLCTVVYPTLYVLKQHLFQKIPKKLDQRVLEKLRSDPEFGEAFKEAEAALKKRAEDLGEEELDFPIAQLEEREITAFTELLEKDLKELKTGDDIDLGGSFTPETSRAFLVALRHQLRIKFWLRFPSAALDTAVSVGGAGQLLNWVNGVALGP